jgi:hypothetical protein
MRESVVERLIDILQRPYQRRGIRAQGYLRLPDGQMVNGFSHGYKRHSTTTLFAALEITTGLVKDRALPRRRRREFLDVMNENRSRPPRS